MGLYLNPGNEGFFESVSSQIYVDKTELIQYTNQVFRTKQKFLCVSRPRRFGKSMAAEMLAAYYQRNCDSQKLFANMNIAKDPSFPVHLNRYNTIFLNMQDFFSRTHNIDRMCELFSKYVLRDLLREYPDFDYLDQTDLIDVLQEIYREYKIPFVFIIDEWDCIFRENKNDMEAQKKYLDFLRNLLKDRNYVGLTYMTGILPIKKYGSHSALNMFDEFSMTNPGALAEYVGFTENEVKALCKQFDMSFQDTKCWYDGYDFSRKEVFIPNSEITTEFITSIRDAGWQEVITAIRNSEELLQATWKLENKVVAEKIQAAHFETSILKYNDENALACVLSLAYYSARAYYTEIRELPSGKGFADIVYLPRKEHLDRPAMIIELKWDKSADSAIRQIKERNYPLALSGYCGNLLMVGINYDTKTKIHECIIEKLDM